MSEYNLTITFLSEHIKTEYLANIDSMRFKEEDGIGLYTFLPGRPTTFYPWTAIAKFEKERVQ